MQMDAFIELQEQTETSVLMSRAEAAELRRRKMEVNPKWDSHTDRDSHEPPRQGSASEDPAEPQSDHQMFSVNPGCLVGHFRLSSSSQRTVRITPKVGIRNVFSLLGAAYRFYSAPHETPFQKESVEYALDKTPVLEPLVRHFSTCVERLLQDGLLANYIEQEQNLKALRGRLVFSQHLAQNFVRSERIYCRFFQSEVDIPENQVILWTLVLLTRAGEWAQAVRQTLHSHILHFGGVSLHQFLPRQFPVFHYDRLSSRYCEVHDWCRLFVDLLSISDLPGQTQFHGYLLDMNTLFERFVASAFLRAKELVPNVSVNYHRRSFVDIDRRVKSEPDLTLQGPGDSVMVADAKYKRTEGEGKAKNPDLYQMISYCTTLGLIGQNSTSVHGVLVYPQSERDAPLGEPPLKIITNKARGSELSIQTLWLDLDCPQPIPDAIEKCVQILEQILPREDTL
jgi:5-methylcytosine-specific restriction enzyme subunit McrC